MAQRPSITITASEGHGASLMTRRWADSDGHPLGETDTCRGPCPWEDGRPADRYTGPGPTTSMTPYNRALAKVRHARVLSGAAADPGAVRPPFSPRAGSAPSSRTAGPRRPRTPACRCSGAPLGGAGGRAIPALRNRYSVARPAVDWDDSDLLIVVDDACLDGYAVPGRAGSSSLTACRCGPAGTSIRSPEWAGPPTGLAGGMTSSCRRRDDLAVHGPWLPGVRGVPENDLAGYKSPRIAMRCLILAMFRTHLPAEDGTVVHERS